MPRGTYAGLSAAFRARSEEPTGLSAVMDAGLLYRRRAGAAVVLYLASPQVRLGPLNDRWMLLRTFLPMTPQS